MRRSKTPKIWRPTMKTPKGFRRVAGRVDKHVDITIFQNPTGGGEDEEEAQWLIDVNGKLTPVFTRTEVEVLKDSLLADLDLTKPNLFGV